MKLKHYFVLLALCIVLLAGAALYSAFNTNSTLFYAIEGFTIVLLCYLGYFYRKTIRPYDTLIGGMELVKDLDLTTRLAPSGQHETDLIVRTFNDLLTRLRSEHLTLEEQYSFLSLLIEASPMGIVQCDIDGKTTSMNPAAREMLSPSIEEAMKALPMGESTTVRLTGGPQLFRISHLSFPDRGFQHPFFLIEPLTAEVRQAEKAAYERIIRMIAHEVNNSVAGIVNLIDSEPAAADRLKALSAFVTRFAEVVKIPKPQLQLCDLSEEVEACQPFLENLCAGKPVHLEFCLTDEASPVHLDTVLFQQVLINIVKNAVESIGNNEGHITVTTTPYQLVVADNGRGIPAEVAQHLFTPFYSTKPQGQGLGLLLIRDILTAHGCTFSLLTDPDDHLTRFTIHFVTK
jgi:nitrogen fixation/metabolism regulation signal transduction histidine kinase